MGAIGLTAAWLLYRSTSIGALPAAAIGSLVLVLLGPVVWPWYFAAAIALFAVCDMGRWRGSLMLVIWLFACEVFPSGPGGSVPDHNHVAATLVMLAIGVIAVTMPFIPGWWAAAKERSENRGSRWRTRGDLGLGASARGLTPVIVVLRMRSRSRQAATLAIICSTSALERRLVAGGGV